MKKKRYTVILVIVCIIVFALILVMHNRYMKNSIDLSQLSNTEITELHSIKYIELPSKTEKGHVFTATGISYDPKINQFLIGNYGKANRKNSDSNPSIINMDFEFSQITKELYFDNQEKVIQGIAYDEFNDSIWYTDGNMVINSTKDRDGIISSFDIGKYSKYQANGICIDARDNSLWVLCMYHYLLNFKKDGSLINAYECDYIGQDHICIDEEGNIYISAGIDYDGSDNFVVCFSEDIKPKKIYRVNGSYAIEGILVMDSKLYVVNDGIYHDAKIKNNYIQEYLLTED